MESSHLLSEPRFPPLDRRLGIPCPRMCEAAASAPERPALRLLESLQKQEC